VLKLRGRELGNASPGELEVKVRQQSKTKRLLHSGAETLPPEMSFDQPLTTVCTTTVIWSFLPHLSHFLS
jgi:hypothetical protein